MNGEPDKSMENSKSSTTFVGAKKVVLDKKILIVEDDFPMAHILKLKLAEMGFHVDHAPDGEQAMDYIGKNPYDIILLDLRLPKKNGFEIIREIRANPQWKHLKIFVLSNLGEKEDLDRAVELGADGYFIKADTNIHSLLKKITDFISGNTPEEKL